MRCRRSSWHCLSWPGRLRNGHPCSEGVTRVRLLDPDIHLAKGPEVSRRRREPLSPIDLGWVRTDPFSPIFRTLTWTEVQLLIACTALNIPIRIVAEEMGISPKRATAQLIRANGKMRDPDRSERLKDWFGAAEHLHLDRSESVEVRNLVEHWEARIPRCERCGGDLVAPGRNQTTSQWWLSSRQGGRPRSYCSSACRQAAYRRRRRHGKQAPPPEQQ
jgi:hypothetical protein